ncbi:F-box domain containing protein [Trema orientale]|uniref:F-box domain containing protein n=1 Tax=Trema orientale TaxID=63057 RepID=A0A2P5EC21_TREOI|nr:F-box domain containing protein [Trema orientale]
MESFSDLPEDILVKIMSWLPPESLFRFKCVQKLWYILITSLVIKNDPFFVAKHLRNSNKKTSIFFRCIKDEKKLQEGFLNIYKNDGNNSSSDVLSYAIKYFKPQSRKYYDSFPKGYDDIDKVYKVVKISGYWFDDLTAQVYTLGINDSWREIKMREGTDDCDLFCDKTVCCKGVSYWLLFNVHTFEVIIYSFDMHDEEFRTIPLPDKFQTSSRGYVLDWDTSLTELNESLALFYHPKDKYGTVSPIEMWIMYESSEGHKFWCKHLSIDPVGGIYKIPILFWKSDELLMMENKKGLVSCNILTKRVRRLHNRKLSTFISFGYVKEFGFS